MAQRWHNVLIGYYFLMILPFQVPAQWDTGLHFEKEIHDFGMITHRDSVQVEFPFEVTTREPAVIFAYGYEGVSVSPRKDTLQPGEKGSLRLSFGDTLDGIFVKAIRIYVKGRPVPALIEIRGERKAGPPEIGNRGKGGGPLKIYPNEIRLQSLNSAETRLIWIHVSNWGAEHIEILGLKQNFPGITALGLPLQLAPGEKSAFSIEIDPVKAADEHRDIVHYIRLSTHPDTFFEEDVITIWGDLSRMNDLTTIRSGPRLHLDIDTLNFGNTRLTRVTTREIMVANTGKAPLTIDNISNGYSRDFKPIITPSHFTLQPGEEKMIQVTQEPFEKSGYARTSISFESNDALYYRKVIWAVRNGILDSTKNASHDLQKTGRIAQKDTQWIAREPVAFDKMAHHLREISYGDSGIAYFRVKNISDTVVTFTGYTSNTPNIKVDLPKVKLEPGESGSIKVKIFSTKPYRDGYFSKQADLEMTPRPRQKVRLTVSGAIRPDPSKIDSSRSPKIEWEVKDVDFGWVAPGRLSAIYKFRNKGTTDLKIQTAKPSCGCMTAQYTRGPIPPGETGEVEVWISLRGKAGTQLKTTTVFTNEPIKHHSILRMRMKIWRSDFYKDWSRRKYPVDVHPLHLETGNISVGTLKRTERAEAVIRFRNWGDEKIQVLGAEGLPAGMEMDLSNPIFEASARDSLVVRIDGSKLQSTGFFSYETAIKVRIAPEKEKEQIKTVIVSIAGIIETGDPMIRGPRIDFEQDRARLGKVPRGEREVVFAFVNSGVKPLVIDSLQAAATSTSGPESYSYTFPKNPVLPGERAEIKVFSSFATMGPWGQKFNVFTNDPEGIRNIYINAWVFDGKNVHLKPVGMGW